MTTAPPALAPPQMAVNALGISALSAGVIPGVPPNAACRAGARHRAEAGHLVLPLLLRRRRARRREPPSATTSASAASSALPTMPPTTSTPCTTRCPAYGNAQRPGDHCQQALLLPAVAPRARQVPPVGRQPQRDAGHDRREPGRPEQPLPRLRRRRVRERPVRLPRTPSTWAGAGLRRRSTVTVELNTSSINDYAFAAGTSAARRPALHAAAQAIRRRTCPARRRSI